MCAFCLLLSLERCESCKVLCMVLTTTVSDCMIALSGICSQFAIWRCGFVLNQNLFLMFSALDCTFDSAVPRKSVRYALSFVMHHKFCLDMHLS